MKNKNYPLHNNVSLLLGTCDAYEDTWKPFFYQLQKHWNSFSMPVYLATESKNFDYKNFNIINPKIGYKADIWSDRIYKTLDQISSEFVLFMLDDFWLTQDIDMNVFNEIVDIMTKDEKIGYINLYADKTDNGKWLNKKGPTRGIQDCEYSLLWETTSECPYRITTSAGLWRKSFFQKILRRHENAWQFEGRANWRVNTYYKSTKILETKERLLFYPNGGFIWGGKCKSNYEKLFPQNLISECIEKRGFYDETTKYEIPSNHKNIKTLFGNLLSYLPFHLPFK